MSARLDVEPLTLRQLGAIHGEFRRLAPGLPRADRLRITAALAEVPSIESTKHLTMGEAGRAIHALRAADELPAARPTSPPVPPEAAAELLAAALVLLGAAVWLAVIAWRQRRAARDAAEALAQAPADELPAEGNA